MAFSRMLLLAVWHSLIFFTMNLLSTYVCSRWIVVFFVVFVCFVFCLFFVLFGVFIVDKINVRSCVSPTATTRQTPVVGWQSSEMSKWAKNSIIVAACPDQSDGTDSEALGLAFHHQGPTFIIAYCQGATTGCSETEVGVGPRGRPNDLLRPRRSVLSECFV